MTENDSVLEFIDAAISFVRPNGEPGYRRGARLVGLLDRGSLVALAEQEFEVGKRLRDCARYAEGITPLTLLEAYYVPSSRPVSETLVRSIVKEGARRLAEGLNDLLSGRPDAGPDDVRDWINGLVASVDHLTVGAGDGGLTLPPGGHDKLMFLGRVELLFKDLPQQPGATEELLSEPRTVMLAALVDRHLRGTAIARLRRIVSDPGSTEHDIHRSLGGNYWMFGGEYMAELAVRNLARGQILDIPLLRGDGALHVVELKQANVPGMISRYGRHLRTGAAVHQAVSQVQNYLLSLDEQRRDILDAYGIDSRRAFGTVVIGHSAFLRAGFTPADLASTLRIYNSHLSRIQVITYDSLLDSAERTLELGALTP